MRARAGLDDGGEGERAVRAAVVGAVDISLSESESEIEADVQ